MGQLYENLCKGPVVVIDDGIGREDDSINMLVEEMRGNNIPVVTAKRPQDFGIDNLLYSSFVILDWALANELDPERGVTTGEEAGTAAIAFINRLKSICLGPIFIISNLDPDDIKNTLGRNGIETEGTRFVFVERKSNLNNWGSLVSQVESWVKESPHVYLTKWWTNEWLLRNNDIFWELYALNRNWSSLFYQSFEERGEDPILGLRDALIQLTSSEIDMSTIESSFLAGQTEDVDLTSLDNLYSRLVYTTRNIESDMRPGDIFRLTHDGEDRYFLNIRPECDTTKQRKDIILYLIEGKSIKPRKIKDRYIPERGQLVPWEDEVLLLYLDKQKVVRFDKNKLEIISAKEMAKKGYSKICRVMPPFVTQIRQSYSNYIARFGLPSYPRQIVDSVFSPPVKKTKN